MTHTPTPWTWHQGSIESVTGEYITQGILVDDATLIVKAVNSYAAMKEALQNTMRVLRQLRDEHPSQWDALLTPDLLNMWDQNKAALALAEGEE